MGNQNHKDIQPIESKALSQPLPASQNLSKTGKIKPLIINKTTWRCLLSTDLAYISKNKPKMLSTIHLARFDHENLKNRGFNILCKSLKDTKNIHSLIIDLIQVPVEVPNKKQLAHLLNLTNRWKKLKIHYSQTETTLSKEIAKKITRLRRCPDLSCLDVSFEDRESSKEKEKIMNHLSQQIRGLPKFKDFTLDYHVPQESFNRVDLDYTFVLLFKYPRSLSSLTLKLGCEQYLPQRLLAQFTSNLQQFDKLEHLSLDFDIIDIQSEPKNTQLSKALFEKLIRLKSLDLPKKLYYDDQEPEPEPIKSFLQDFSHLKNIISLDIKFDYDSREITFPALLSNYLASFPHLKSVKLYFLMSKCIGSHPPADLLDISPSIHYLSQLEDLQLDFWDNDINNDFLQCLAQFLQHLPMLKSLKLSIWDFLRSQYSPLFLTESLQRLTHLKKLDLYFSLIDFDYASMETLSKNIAHLQLNSLSLHLGRSKPEKTILQRIGSLWEDTHNHRLPYFFSTLSSLNLLSVLNLDLSMFDLSIPEYKHFALALKELNSLISLSLTLPEFDSPEILQELLSSLANKPKLTSLLLDFKSREFSLKEISPLTLNLGDCKSLEKLELRFLYGSDFDGETLNYLLSGIANLLSLRDLKLSPQGKPKFDSVQAYRLLLQELTTLKNLEYLRFYSRFREPSRDRSQRILQDLKEKLVDHPNFKRLVFLDLSQD